MNRRLIGVLGAGTCSAEIAGLAYVVGNGIAERGGVLVCGGLGGVMEAACKGARNRNGLTVGILPGADISQANSYVEIPIATGMAEARNIMIVHTCEVAVAIGGEYGTLSEISFCLKFKVPLIGLNTWKISPEIIQAETAREAVDKVFELLEPRGSP